MEDAEPGTTCIATFCGGSFWDIESAFRHVRGVIATSVGFMGGFIPSPTYEGVCSGTTGHSEVVMIGYNPAIVSFLDLLDIFFRSHNPCQKQQGEYRGLQYEPVIFCHSDQDKQVALKYVTDLQHEGRCPEGIVTRIAPASAFFRAEEYHQQFYEKMGGSYTVLHTGDHGYNE
ncbi:MAG: peptide-methionine (S)-S-oxide reductase MsrA [Methanoregulaceae archaeon]|jgi:peptide-methionine (S)-S-oxide reductase|nr:peptide-methionine (S)-S-oxide reductase MsrA [Methanoregulaceae archaeon]